MSYNYTYFLTWKKSELTSVPKGHSQQRGGGQLCWGEGGTEEGCAAEPEAGPCMPCQLGGSESINSNTKRKKRGKKSSRILQWSTDTKQAPGEGGKALGRLIQFSKQRDPSLQDLQIQYRGQSLSPAHFPTSQSED